MERRIQALEARMNAKVDADEKYLPDWLVEDWKAQGACFNENGRITSFGPDPENTDQLSSTADDTARLSHFQTGPEIS